METLISAPYDNQQLVLSLIKEDLINTKLISNLNDIGIDAENYNLNLRIIIMRMMGLQHVNDETHEKYSEFTHQSKDIKFTESAKLLDPLAYEIYNFLGSLDPKAVRTEKPLQINKAIVTDLIKQDLINWKNDQYARQHSDHRRRLPAQHRTDHFRDHGPRGTRRY